MGARRTLILRLFCGLPLISWWPTSRRIGARMSERLQMHGVPVFICFPRTVIEAIGTLRRLAQITGAELQASPVLARIEAAYEETKALSMGSRRVRVFCPIWKHPWMTINHDTFIHDMIETCGGTNVFASRERRFPLAADLGQQAEWEARAWQGAIGAIRGYRSMKWRD